MIGVVSWLVNDDTERGIEGRVIVFPALFLCASGLGI